MTCLGPFVRVAITSDGKIEIWDKSKGIELAILDYREPEYPKVTTSKADEQIGFDGDY